MVGGFVLFSKFVQRGAEFRKLNISKYLSKLYVEFSHWNVMSFLYICKDNQAIQQLCRSK